MPAPKGHEPYNKNREGGRPVKYTTEFIEKEAEAFDEWMKKSSSMWYKDFCLERNYLPDVLTDMASRNERFSEVYKKSQVWQESLLVRAGLLNKFNPPFTKFVLANTSGWSDKQQTVLSGDAANPLNWAIAQVDGITKDLIDEIENDD